MNSEMSPSQFGDYFRLYALLHGVNKEFVDGKTTNDVESQLQDISLLFQKIQNQSNENNTASITNWLSVSSSRRIGFFVIASTALTIIAQYITASLTATTKEANTNPISLSSMGVGYTAGTLGVFTVAYNIFSSYINKNQQIQVEELKSTYDHTKANIFPLITTLNTLKSNPNSDDNVKEVMKVLTTIPSHSTVPLSLYHWISAVLKSLPQNSPIKVQFDQLCELAKSISKTPDGLLEQKLSSAYISFQQSLGVVLPKIFIDDISFGIDGIVEKNSPVQDPLLLINKSEV